MDSAIACLKVDQLFLCRALVGDNLQDLGRLDLALPLSG